jgi:hypothetical protein
MMLHAIREGIADDGDVFAGVELEAAGGGAAGVES